MDASGSRRPEQPPRIPLQEDEEEMIFELLVAGAFALATLRRCVYIAEFYSLSLTHIYLFRFRNLASSSLLLSRERGGKLSSLSLSRRASARARHKRVAGYTRVGRRAARRKDASSRPGVDVSGTARAFGKMEIDLSSIRGNEGKKTLATLAIRVRAGRPVDRSRAAADATSLFYRSRYNDVAATREESARATLEGTVSLYPRLRGESRSGGSYSSIVRTA